MARRPGSGLDIADLDLGDQVYTGDRRRLGVVHAKTNDHFKVHVRWGRDYWLSLVLVRNLSERTVTLHVSSKVVNRYKQRNPNGWGKVNWQVLNPIRLFRRRVAAPGAELQ